MTTSVETVPRQIVAALGGREPTPEQWRAISMPLEPCVVVAGAGSGKTSVMAARVVYLALVALGLVEAECEGVLPGNVLCLTFTNKATENLAFRVRSALASLDLEEGEEPVVMNYHAFAAQIIERHGLLAGLEPGKRILTDAQRREVAGRVLDRMTFSQVRAEWQPSVVDQILKLAEQAANHLVTPDEIVAFNEERMEVVKKAKSKSLAKAAAQRIELARAVGLYQSLKDELGVLDFGDQIRLAVEIVERFPEVVRDYRTRFGAVLLDEYQDTNVAQARMIAAVFGDGFPVTAVGDPDQNIYAWRGASLHNLLRFPEQFPRSDRRAAEKLPLYTNFRSGARILAAADLILEPLPVSQRPDPDKELVPWGPNGSGEVQLVRTQDEWTEARWIADTIVDLHRGGERWGDIAILCRKSRLFTPLQRALEERAVPAEFVGLSGLVKLPPVQEVLAYARAVANPRASVSLARILLGPRYRVGYTDLARVAAWASGKNAAIREEIDEDEDTGFLFAEALEHLDEIAPELSSEGLTRLHGFRDELAELRVEARRPVDEFLAQVIRRTGLAAELAANLEREPAVAARRNLAAFLDQVREFQPLEGELTLSSFLDYVDDLESLERQEWSPVQPSDEDSVKVMTVHQAKGLEFDTVFVPGLANELLPDTTIQQNPAERGYSLDFELRGDRDELPAFDGAVATFKERLKKQEEFEERRTCYVALTRARHRLFVTGAHWYGEGDRMKKASIFFDELADWGEETGDAVVERGPEGDGDAGNPLLGYRERFVRDWPGPALRPEADELFPGGWRAAAAEAASEGGVQGSLLEALDTEGREMYRGLADGWSELATHLREREQGQPGTPELPPTLSVTGLVDYARCPKRFYWSVIRPLPRFSGPAARIGTEIHRWIELQASGQASLLETEEAPDLTVEELVGEPGRIESLRDAFRASRFAGVVPLAAEQQFLLRLGEFTVNGRIDAIYGEPNGRWEVVDYKTGRKPDADDPVAQLQLDLYALACIDVWRKRAEDLRLTYLYLATGEEVTEPAGEPSETRERVLTMLRGVAAGEFEPTPGPQCRWCDFRTFCQAGSAWLATAARAADPSTR